MTLTSPNLDMTINYNVHNNYDFLIVASCVLGHVGVFFEIVGLTGCINKVTGNCII